MIFRHRDSFGRRWFFECSSYKEGMFSILKPLQEVTNTVKEAQRRYDEASRQGGALRDIDFQLIEELRKAEDAEAAALREHTGRHGASVADWLNAAPGCRFELG